MDRKRYVMFFPLFVCLFSTATALTVDRHAIIGVNRNIRRSTIDCVAIVRREREFGHASTRAKGKLGGVPFAPFGRTSRFSCAGNLLPSRPPPSPRTSATQTKLQRMCRKITLKGVVKTLISDFSSIPFCFFLFIINNSRGYFRTRYCCDIFIFK